MERRDFLKKSLSLVALFELAPVSRLLSNSKIKIMGSSFDLVAIKGADPVRMFDKGIEALGGMKAFVKKGQTVVIKPNIGWDQTPEFGANTNPWLVARVVEHCLWAGAKSVYVFDHSCDDWTKCYLRSGIQKAAKEKGAILVSGREESYYRQVKIPGLRLHEAKVHELILDSNLFINIPVLKHHSATKMTCAMKNLMGCVWDREYWHKNDLNQCIADFLKFRKPDLNIVDAYRSMFRNGPRGVSIKDLRFLKSQIISRDIVSADAASARLFGLDPMSLPYLKKASEMGSGRADLDKLNIKRLYL